MAGGIGTGGKYPGEKGWEEYLGGHDRVEMVGGNVRGGGNVLLPASHVVRMIPGTGVYSEFSQRHS